MPMPHLTINPEEQIRQLLDLLDLKPEEAQYLVLIVQRLVSELHRRRVMEERFSSDNCKGLNFQGLGKSELIIN